MFKVGNRLLDGVDNSKYTYKLVELNKTEDISGK